MRAKIFIGPAATGKTRVAMIIREFFEQNHVIIDGKQLTSKRLHNPFCFSAIPDDTQLLIIDDVPKNFDFFYFFDVIDNRYKGGDLKFKIWVEKRGEPRKYLEIPYLIFTANDILKKWERCGASFSERFEIIRFPLSTLQ